MQVIKILIEKYAETELMNDVVVGIQVLNEPFMYVLEPSPSSFHADGEETERLESTKTLSTTSTSNPTPPCAEHREQR